MNTNWIHDIITDPENQPPQFDLNSDINVERCDEDECRHNHHLPCCSAGIIHIDHDGWPDKCDSSIHGQPIIDKNTIETIPILLTKNEIDQITTSLDIFITDRTVSDEEAKPKQDIINKIDEQTQNILQQRQDLKDKIIE